MGPSHTGRGQIENPDPKPLLLLLWFALLVELRPGSLGASDLAQRLDVVIEANP